MKDDILLGDTAKARRRRQRADKMTARGRLWKHSTLADIEGLVAASVLNDLFAFTLVRNPWDRAVSYYHWLRDRRFAHPAVALAATLDFAGFLAHPLIRAGFRTHPASAYMRRSDGVEHCAAYIRIERFGDDAAPLFAHLGFRFDLPVVNHSRRDRDYRRYYDDAGAAIVAEDCADDIARFGYCF